MFQILSLQLWITLKKNINLPIFKVRYFTTNKRSFYEIGVQFLRQMNTFLVHNESVIDEMARHEIVRLSFLQ